MTSRGSAVVEFSAVAGFVVVLVTVTLVAAYLAFARAYLEYRTEQALYCLAERRHRTGCAEGLRRAVNGTLAFGRIQKMRLVETRDTWKVELTWQIHDFVFRFDKTLDRRRVLRKALPS